MMGQVGKTRKNNFAQLLFFQKNIKFWTILLQSTLVCKANQKTSHNNNLLCRAGCSEVETQDHLLNCPNILGEVGEIDCTIVKKRGLESHKRTLQELLRRMDMVENWCEEQ